MTSDRPTTRGIILPLEGLRALFLLWVLFHNLPASALPRALQTVQHSITFGVDGFLAISGYLVTRSLEDCIRAAAVARRGRGAAIREFLLRRAARIWPPYFAVLGGVQLLGTFAGGAIAKSLAEFSDLYWRFWTFTANYAITTHNMRIPGAFQSWWSISYQEQFYLLLAFLAWGLQRRLGYALVGCAIGSFLLRAALTFGPWGDYGHAYHLESDTHLNLDAMAWGCLAWILRDQLAWIFVEPGRARAFTWLAVAVTAVAIGLRAVIPGDRAMGVLIGVRAIGLALIVAATAAAAAKPGMVARLLSARPLLLISRISFEAYLLHALGYTALMQAGVPSHLLAPTGIAFALGGGALFHFGLGLPAKRWIRGRSAIVPQIVEVS